MSGEEPCENGPRRAEIARPEEDLGHGDQVEGQHDQTHVAQHARLVVDTRNAYPRGCELPDDGVLEVEVEAAGETVTVKLNVSRLTEQVLEMTRRMSPEATVWISDPTWPNHPQVFGAAGLPVRNYPYLGEDGELDIDTLLGVLKGVPAGDVVVLHGCCHNPTGIDPSVEEWSQIGELLRRRGVLPVGRHRDHDGVDLGSQLDRDPCDREDAREDDQDDGYQGI